MLAWELHHFVGLSELPLGDRFIRRSDKSPQRPRRERDFARASLGNDEQKVAPDLNNGRGISKKAARHIHSTPNSTRQLEIGAQAKALIHPRSTDMVNSPAAPETLARGARRSSLGARPFSLPLEP